MTAPDLGHGLGRDLVPPDWPRLTPDDIAALLRHYPSAGNLVAIRWHSPRPFSSAAIVETTQGEFFVKRVSSSTRPATALRAEHCFIDALRRGGVGVPDVVATSTGDTVVEVGDSTVELQYVLRGLDSYRDALSWTPYLSTAHARAAGEALARLHLAARSHPAAARAGAGLVSGSRLIAHPEALGAFVAERPALADYLAGQRFSADFARHLGPALDRVAPRLAALPTQWTHNDWHPSNFTWTPDGAVCEAFDFGLADRAHAVHDLATAVERTCIEWLDLPDAAVHLDQVAALVAGYTAVRPLTSAERAVLPDLMSVVHLELALSEVDYFAGVVGSRASADLAYESYLLGHAAFFSGPSGRAVTQALSSLPPAPPAPPPPGPPPGPPPTPTI